MTLCLVRFAPNWICYSADFDEPLTLSAGGILSLMCLPAAIHNRCSKQNRRQGCGLTSSTEIGLGLAEHRFPNPKAPPSQRGDPVSGSCQNMPELASGRQLSGNNWQHELGTAKTLLITIVRANRTHAKATDNPTFTLLALQRLLAPPSRRVF